MKIAVGVPRGGVNAWHHRCIVVPALVVLLFAMTSPAAAQEVRGQLIDTETHRPVPMALVALLDTNMAVARQVVTDTTGRFTLRAPRPGEYLLVAERIGYQRTVDGLLTLRPGQPSDMELYMRPEALELGSLLATARRDRAEIVLELVGFFDRMKQGHGHFITPAELAERPAVSARDLLRGIPRVTTQDNGYQRGAVFFRGGMSGLCTPQGWVDGVAVSSTLASPGFALEEVVAVEDIQAVEIYTGAASAPQQFGGINAGCGTLLIWTRNAEDPASRRRDF